MESDRFLLINKLTPFSLKLSDLRWRCTCTTRSLCNGTLLSEIKHLPKTLIQPNQTIFLLSYRFRKSVAAIELITYRACSHFILNIESDQIERNQGAANGTSNWEGTVISNWTFTLVFRPDFLFACSWDPHFKAISCNFQVKILSHIASDGIKFTLRPYHFVCWS